MEVSRQYLVAVSECFPYTHSKLTPGSVTDAWTKDEIHIKKRYAKKNGTAGETFSERYGPLSHCTHHQWRHGRAGYRFDLRVYKEKDSG